MCNPVFISALMLLLIGRLAVQARVTHHIREQTHLEGALLHQGLFVDLNLSVLAIAVRNKYFILSYLRSVTSYIT